jgi:hypothetical protein
MSVASTELIMSAVLRELEGMQADWADNRTARSYAWNKQSASKMIL